MKILKANKKKNRTILYLRQRCSSLQKRDFESNQDYIDLLEAYNREMKVLPKLQTQVKELEKENEELREIKGKYHLLLKNL